VAPELDSLDLSATLPRADYRLRLGKYQVRLRELEFELFKARIPAVVCFEGWDAAGKGGTIKRLTQYLDPRGFSVIPIAAPAGDERVHHYLWRFWKHVPKAGHMAIFDRSWYGRVLVERVESFCSEADWQRAYREINEFERQLHAFGTVICKFWLHISPEEQLRRFQERQGNEFKSWKLTGEDWRNRQKWDR
jgi:polyphosphate kinase 2 (PPK2 family)